MDVTMDNDSTIHHFDGRTLAKADLEPVREFPLKLIVNGRELATLVSSPHDLRFLVAGFLRSQGFVQCCDDFLLFSVCTDFGVANVRIRGDLPEKLQPVLTSGCGAGITFTLPGSRGAGGAWQKATSRFNIAAVFSLMDQLTRRAGQYRRHGGIHSAAVGDCDGSLLIHAEDLGRHNTIDRIAGEALLTGLDLTGRMLVTSGRISSEMAAKAADQGIALIASRTSPTDMAVKICKEAGIVLIGYLRGGRFNVYNRPEGLIFSCGRECDVSCHTPPVSSIP